MRGKRAPKREIQPDYKFRDLVVAKLINYVMKKGKKAIAERIVYNAFDLVSEKTKQNPMDVFETAMKNVTPTVEVKSRRVRGANYQIPIPVRGDRRITLALRWILIAARSKSGKAMSERLAAEIMAAANNEGDAIKKKQDVQKMAEANRAFAHFAR